MPLPSMTTQPPKLSPELQSLDTYNGKNLEIQALIGAYKEHKTKFNSVSFKSKQVWDIIEKKVSKDLVSQGKFIVPKAGQCD